MSSPHPETDASPSWPTPALRERVGRRVRRWRRAVLRRRRPLAALCAATAAGLAMLALRPPEALTTQVLVASRDLPAGQVLTDSDLRPIRLPRSAAPAGLDGAPLGETLAGPVRRGEPITDVRLVGASLTAGSADRRALPVRFPDAESVSLLRPGDRIDVHGAPADGGQARLVAADVTVLAIPPADVRTGSSEGRLVVLGVPWERVAGLAGSGVADFLTYSFAR